MVKQTIVALGVFLATAVGLGGSPSLRAEQLSGPPLCIFPDLAGVTAVALTEGAGDPAGSADPIPGGRWQLTALLYRPSIPIEITGDATGVIELEAISPSAGQFSAALDINITTPTQETRSETGAGPYAQMAGMLDFTNQCGDALTLSDTLYRVDSSGAEPVLTLWGQVEIPVEDPFPLVVTIELEADFLRVESQTALDPIFDDRFETP
ncbi:MAG: hypothetical protein V2J42_07755 [Wenzhouxiangella sp.]|jgi:hypothetical protein|nr:hypothetical protein [Wenzhouxiangella sp.]